MSNIPKDITPFIGKTKDYPWPSIMVWNPYDEMYVYVTLQAQTMMQTKGMDTWFQNEQCTEDSIEWWKPMPEKIE